LDKKFIEGKDLLQRWNIADWELLKRVRCGLDGYRFKKKRWLLCPYHRAYREPFKIRISPFKYLDRSPRAVLLLDEIEDLLPLLPDCLFLNEDVLTVEKLEPALCKESQNPTEKTKDIEAAKPISQMKQENFFIREGTIWHIGFKGTDARIKHFVGLQYIGYLLEKPGMPISCRDLYQAVSGTGADNPMSKSAAIDQELNIGSSMQAVSDRKAREIYLEKYQELQEKLPNVGIEEQEEIEDKMKALLPHLTRRNIPDPNEKKAQVNIGKRLDTAYKAINKAKMEKLAKHLQENIKPDGAFGLSYSGSLTWEITL
jgi:hypothetical protein